MKLLIHIPKEFEQHFQMDRFEDSLNRLSADAHLLAGLYEQETASMLSEAFKNAVLVPSCGRLIDADVLYRRIKTECNPYGKPTINFDDGNKVMDMIAYAPTIIPAEEGKT